MATLYAKSAGGNWSAAATWSNVSSMGSDSSGPPTSGDNCILDMLSGNVTIDATASCRSLDCQGGMGNFPGTLTHNSGITLSIGDGTAGTGNRALRLFSSMTYTLGSATTSAISFVSTSSTQQSIATAGKTLGNIAFNGSGGTWQQSDSLTSSGSWTWTNGSWDGNSQTRTFNGSGVTFGGGGKTYTGTTSLTGGGALTISGANTFTNLTYTGTAAKTGTLSLSSDQTITGVWTISGNSATNRVLVQSNTIGTARTITNSGATMTWSNCDFRDITLGTSFDASAITGKSGDCGGNSGITFTTGATQTWSGTSGGNWSANAWTSRVPLPQDDVTINAAFTASQTVTLDMPRAGKSITWSNTGNSVAWSKSTATTIYGSLVMTGTSLMTNSGTTSFTMEGRGVFTFTSAGQTFTNAITIAAVGGSVEFLDAFTGTAGTPTITCSNGEAKFGSYTHSVTGANSSGTGTRTLTMSTSTFICTGGGFNCATSTNLTVTSTTGTIRFSDTSSSSKTFAGGGKSFGIFDVTTGGTGAVIITGANSFIRITATGGGTKTFTLPGSTTTTLTGTTPFPSGVASNLLTFGASSGSATVSCANTVDADYLDLTNIVGAGAGIPFYAGTHSVDHGGNTNWTFSDRPTGFINQSVIHSRAVTRAASF